MYKRQDSPSTSDSQNSMGYWKLEGCHNNACSDVDYLLYGFGLSFGDDARVAISASRAYPRYRLVFLNGPVDRNGAYGRKTFSEIKMDYAK